MSVMVIGYGNTLRGDDGLGWVAAERLAEILPPSVSVLQRHQLGIEMVEDIADIDHLVLIDVTASEAPGTITCRQLMATREAYGMLEHHVHPEVLLTTCLALHGRMPEATLFTVGADSFDFSEELSPPVQAALPVLVHRVAAHIASL